jgi:hypothetical protein
VQFEDVVVVVVVEANTGFVAANTGIELVVEVIVVDGGIGVVTSPTQVPTHGQDRRQETWLN